LASIDHSLHQPDSDAATRHQHPYGVGSNIEEQIASEDALDLVAPLLAAAAHLTQQRIELDYDLFSLTRPCILQCVHRAEVQLDRLDIDLLLVDNLRSFHRLDDLSQDLANDGRCPHLRRYHQQPLGSKLSKIGDLAFGERLEAAEVGHLAGEPIEKTGLTVFFHAVLDAVQRQRWSALRIDGQPLPEQSDLAHLRTLDGDGVYLLAVVCCAAGCG